MKKKFKLKYILCFMFLSMALNIWSHELYDSISQVDFQKYLRVQYDDADSIFYLKDKNITDTIVVLVQITYTLDKQGGVVILLVNMNKKDKINNITSNKLKTYGSFLFPNDIENTESNDRFRIFNSKNSSTKMDSICELQKENVKYMIHNIDWDVFFKDHSTLWNSEYNLYLVRVMYMLVPSIRTKMQTD